MSAARTAAISTLVSLCLAGAVLTVLGDVSPYAGLLALVFLLVAPALAAWPLLPGLAAPARAIVSAAVTFVVDTAVAQVMLSLGLWSPRGGVAAVLVVCTLLGLFGLVLSYRTSHRAGRSPVRTQEEDWVFEN